jgi:putative redox protein
VKARVKLLEGMSMVAEAGSGHAVVLDAAPEIGGRNLGFRPMEMLLMGLAGCTAIDVLGILAKSRQKVDDLTVDVEAERAPEEPKVFTRIQVHFTVTGRGLQVNHVRRAVNLSAEKYCSASIMLGKMAEISHDFRIVETDLA